MTYFFRVIYDISDGRNDVGRKKEIKLKPADNHLQIEALYLLHLKRL